MSTITLAPRLDLSTASTTAEAIRNQRGTDLTLDASQVTHLGGLGLQVILSAARTWAQDGTFLTIEPRSEAFNEALALFGVAADAHLMEVEA